MKLRTAALTALAFAVLLPQAARAQFVQTDNVAFEALNQSMWGGSGPASFEWNSGNLLKTSWAASGSIDATIGDESTQITPYIPAVITPAVPRTQLTPYIPPQLITPAVPRTQITPAIPAVYAPRVCAWGVCVGGGQITPAIPAVYSPAIPAIYSPAIPATYSPYIPPIQVSPAIPAVYADTRTGAAFTGSTDGTIGLEVGAYASSGRVDVTMPGAATLTTSGLTSQWGEVYTIGTGFAVDPVAMMTTQFPTLELYADFVFDVYAGGTTTGCIIGAGCADVTGTFIDVNETIELASVNRDGSGTVNILGFDTGALPVSTSVGPVSVEVGLPNLETTAAATATSLTSMGDVDVLSLGVDVPAMVADFVLPGSSCLLGCGVELGPLSLGYTVLGSSLGPDFGIGQEFHFTSTPMTTLEFSVPVSRIVEGVTLAPVTSFDVAMGTNVDIIFPEAAALDVTPTYWLANTLSVGTDFLSRGTFSVDILALNTPIGDLGPLYSYSASTDDLVIDIDDRSFGLNFNRSRGSTFSVVNNFRADFVSLEVIDGIEYYVDSSGNRVAVPEPSTIMLLLTGLFAMGLASRSRRRTAVAA